MRTDEIKQLIKQGESLSTVFARRISSAYINERRVIEIMACLANAEGGTLLIGVDSDGNVSGCHPFHGDHTDPAQLAAAIFRQTSPGLPVDVTLAEVDGREVVAIHAHPQPSPVATKWGVYRTRRLNAQGTPECAGMEPAYLFTRYRDANGMDWALSPAGGASMKDLDPRAIATYRAMVNDERLRSLSEAPLVRALGFLDDSAEPVSLGAVALFGTAEALRRHLPHHQLTVSDRRGTPRTVRSSAPLAPMLADLKRNEESLGAAFPLVVNALVHRDYFMPGAVYVALDADGARVSSPGGAPRGVDLEAAAAGTPTYAPRSLYLATALARTDVMPGAGEGLAAAGAGRVSFAGTHEQGVVASVEWAGAKGAKAGKGASTSVAHSAGTNEERALAAVRAIGEAGASSSEVAERAGLSGQQAYRALRKLVGAGLVRRTGETRMTRYLP